MTRRPVLIAGAGIAGLALALALSRHRVASRILERRDALSEAGAGIQLGPNAMQVLERLGVAGALGETAGRPEAINVAQGATGKPLARFPLGLPIAERFGAPYLVAHRADLQAALLQGVRKTPGIELVTGFEVARWDRASGGLIVSAESGQQTEGDLLVGADGLWSTVRRALFAGHPLTYSGKMAARAVIPAARAAERFAGAATGVWLSADAHVVHYPVRAGREIAVVVVVDEARPREGWGGAIEAADVIGRLKRFAPELLNLLGLASDWRAWSLYDPPPLPAWSKGPIGLIGDAAHPILPFLAQGGAMALEDAETLATLIAPTAGDPARAFQRFESLRRDRVLKVQNASRANGRIFHLQGAAGTARNLALRALPGGLMMRRYDWLYGWNGDGQ